MTPVVRVLLVDDHKIVCDGLTFVLQRENWMTVVGCAGNGEEAVEAARRLKPDVIVMDLVLPALNGFDATRRIVFEEPRSRVVVLSASKTPDHVYRAFRAGARGYVLKAAAGRELVAAIREAMAGRQYVSSDIAGLFVGGPMAGPIPKSRFETLSGRERDVLKRISAGSTSGQIARELSLSPKTVDTYRARIMVKLGVSGRGELVRLTREYELPAV